jgi:SAM-dependent methyltransferase
MRILVAIAHHGSKNRPFLERLLDEYASMAFDVDIVVLSERAKSFVHDVEVIVGLPSDDPWSLPFGHRDLFAQRRDDYDLFIYSEDDTLITEDNLRAFLEECDHLPGDLIAGFVRYEVTTDGRRFFPDSHSHYHWRPGSVTQRARGLYASYSNEHSACFVLTRAQLDRCLESGGFLVAPHAGRYDMLVSAATDPYTSCGLTKVLPLDRIEDFLVHHLPNVYVDRLGSSDTQFSLELEALRETAGRCADRLFDPEKTLSTELWDKSFHEPLPPPMRELAFGSSTTILSLGVGDGEVERQLLARGAKVYGIGLDGITTEVAARKGVSMLPIDLGAAVSALDRHELDAILALDVLPHVPDPVGMLSELMPTLRPGGRLYATAKNATLERLGWMLGRRPKPPSGGAFATTGLRPAGERTLRRWVASAGYRSERVDHWSTGRSNRYAERLPSAFDRLTSDRVMITALRP